MSPIHKTPKPRTHLWKVLEFTIQIQCMLFFLNTPVKISSIAFLCLEDFALCQMNPVFEIHIKLTIV